MNDSIEHYEAGMMENAYLGSETDECCSNCGRALLGWEVEDEMTICGTCILQEMRDRTNEERSLWAAYYESDDAFTDLSF